MLDFCLFLPILLFWSIDGVDILYHGVYTALTFSRGTRSREPAMNSHFRATRHNAKRTDRFLPVRSFGAEGGIRTRATVSHTTPLAGEPLEPLGYFCMAHKAILLYHIFSSLSKLFALKRKNISGKFSCAPCKKNFSGRTFARPDFCFLCFHSISA